MASEVFSKEDVEELATQLLDSNGDSLGGDNLGKRSLEDAELPDAKKAKEAMGNITCEDPADIGVDAGMCAGGVPGDTCGGESIDGFDAAEFLAFLDGAAEVATEEDSGKVLENLKQLHDKSYLDDKKNWVEQKKVGSSSRLMMPLVRTRRM